MHAPPPAPPPQYDVRSASLHRLGFDWPWRVPRSQEELMSLLACIGECGCRQLPLPPGLQAWVEGCAREDVALWREEFLRLRVRIRPSSAHYIALALGLDPEG